MDAEIARYSNRSTFLVLSQDKDPGKKNENVGRKRFGFVEYSNTQRVMALLSRNYHLYELINGDKPRYFYLDIDLKREDASNYEIVTLDGIIQDVRSLIINVIAKFNEVLENKQNVPRPEPLLDDMQISYVEDTRYKKSLHIVFKRIFMRNHRESAQFADILRYLVLDQQELFPNLLEIRQIDSKISSSCIIDKAVYTKSQSFRMLYQSKNDSDEQKRKRVLIPYPGSSTEPLDHLVQIYSNIKDIAYTFNADDIFDVVTTLSDRIELRRSLTQGNRTSHRLDWEMYSIMQFITVKDRTKQKFITVTDPNNLVETIVSKIHNSSEFPQPWNGFWFIGQTLKNISEELGDENKYLDLWIRWCGLCKVKFPNYEQYCKAQWKEMLVKKDNSLEGYKSGVHSLIKITQLYAEDPLKSYNELVEMSNLAVLHELDFSGFQTEKSMFNVENYNNPNGRCKPYNLDYDIVVAQSPMGSGKTHQIKDALFNRLEERILIVSPRRSFSREKVGEFNNLFKLEGENRFVDYSDVDTRTTNMYDVPKLAIQYESIHKLYHEDILSTLYDVVILDEIESILYQTSSTTNKEYESNNMTLMYLIINARNTIIADAFITNRTISMLKSIQKHYNKSIQISINESIPQKGKKVIVKGLGCNLKKSTDVKLDHLHDIIERLGQGEKIAAIYGSRAFKDEVIHEVQKKFASKDGFKIKNYDSNTSEQEMKSLENVNEVWSDPEIKLLTYTTKITVGISFDKKDVFDRVMMSVNSSNAVPRDFIQAHYRIRDTKTKEVNLSILDENSAKGMIEYLPLSRAANAIKSLNDMFGVAPSGNQSVFNVFTVIEKYNKYEDMLAKTMFSATMLNYFKRCGYEIVTEGLGEEELPDPRVKGNYMENEKLFKLFSEQPYLINHDFTELNSKVTQGKASDEENWQLKMHFHLKTLQNARVNIVDNSLFKGDNLISRLSLESSLNLADNLDALTGDINAKVLSYASKKVASEFMIPDEEYKQCNKTKGDPEDDKYMRNWIVWRYMYFMMCSNDTMIKTYTTNISTEVNSSTFLDVSEIVNEVGQWASYNKKEALARLRFVKLMNTMLGVKYSVDISDVQTDKMEQVHSYISKFSQSEIQNINSVFPRGKKLFNISKLNKSFAAKSAKKPAEVTKSTVNRLLKQWIGVNLKATVLRRGSKDRLRRYDINYSCSKNALYTTFLKSVREGVREGGTDVKTLPESKFVDPGTLSVDSLPKPTDFIDLSLYAIPTSEEPQVEPNESIFDSATELDTTQFDLET
ncbi:hypothetical protein M427DRAFT_50296 [Gonapodya prolifera JEL478]|uniref:Replication origin-binding protein n=1 Tax=Gonapodya prolifera (strain JEL478) TaxID=1344416 RepID=A0A138ZX15_GONPJ|nr:hypothetical protein M427DRAFT_50296 [Gonapodya prolifera JEL478]|eukprot:KXS08815.1 hypothetical protein M427DRAFT_50296 [Gonapodya prolifera JEL478]